MQWSTPVCELTRDDFVLEDAWATNHLTLEDILCHRTGLPGHDRALGSNTRGVPHWDKPRPATIEAVRRLRHLPMTTEPRTTYQYNNVMYEVTQHIIETLTGQWLGLFLRERIWQPLGMNSTYFGLEDSKRGKDELATGYLFDEQNDKYIDVPNLDEDAPTGCGSIISNAEDYAKWINAIITRSDVLPPSAWDELLRPRMLMANAKPFIGPHAYAFGWRTGVCYGQQFYQHSGGLDAYSTWVVILPDLKFGVAAFANTAGSGAYVVRSLAWRLVEDKLKIPAPERFDWNGQGRQAIKDGIASVEKAREHFYSGVSEPQPWTLPLQQYTGKYFHPGYGELEIYLDNSSTKGKDNPVLRADRTKTTWHEYMTFEHVSRDFFLVKADWFGDFAAFYPDVYPAEFRVGADGRVAEVGIRWEPSMRDNKIWLKKV